jgi:glutathione synthase/RimK-type ligase-like ATP-grasp enzyme
VLLIGSAHGRRTTLLRTALQARGARLTVIEWRDLLMHEDSVEQELRTALTADHVWCKVDPPSEDAAVTEALIARGWRLAGSDGPTPQPLSYGELALQHWRFSGFADVMSRLERRLGTLQLMNPVHDILVMCDKLACQRHLQQHGVPVPELIGAVRSLGELDEHCPARRFPAVFVKARFGSSAAGVIALRRHPDGRVIAYTSARIDSNGRIFNHLKVSRYTQRESIALLFEKLAAQGAYAERWIPKPRVPADRSVCYDLRVIAACGKARQRVARISRSPMTNLHLGNRRASPDWLSDSQTLALEHATARAAGAFANSRCIGFDVSLHDSAFYIFEANAFGDLLPGLQYSSATTYEDQASWVSADER